MQQSDPAPAKATLFCPTCDHRSRYDGDWRLLDGDRTVRYLCPECGTELASRPGDR